MKKYSLIPMDLYRFQSKNIPTMRQKHTQFLKGSPSYDFIIGQNKLYNPSNTDTYKGPNGLSLRPIGKFLAKQTLTFSSKFIYEIPKGLVIPSNFVLIHEHSDHYSLQTAQPIEPKQFCILAANFFKQQKLITKEELHEKIRQNFVEIN